jgi:hypothetical protein
MKSWHVTYKDITGQYYIEGSVGSKTDLNLISAAPDLLEALKMAVKLIAVAENNGAFKDCALPLIGKKSLEKMESLLERVK